MPDPNHVVESDLRQTFAARLRTARESKKLTPKELVQRAKLGSAQALWNYEQGKRLPRPEHLVALADVLDASIDWLLGTPRAALHRPATLVRRDDEETHRASLDLWEKSVERRRCTAPHLFDTLMLLPEVADWLHLKRRGQERSAEEKAREREWRSSRLQRFARGKWHEVHLCSRHEVEAFVHRQGPYQGIPDADVLAQLDLALEVLERFGLRCSVRLTPLVFRFSYRIYDDRRVVLNSVRNYVVFDDPDVVSKFVAEFEEVWTFRQNEFDPVGYLQRLREEVACSVATSVAVVRPAAAPRAGQGPKLMRRRRSTR